MRSANVEVFSSPAVKCSEDICDFGVIALAERQDWLSTFAALMSDSNPAECGQTGDLIPQLISYGFSNGKMKISNLMD
jgi:hypothetical protein